MRTKKMIKYVLAVVILPFLAMSCQEEEATNEEITTEVDITKWKWELKRVNAVNKTLAPQKNDYFRDNAFLLEFISDSTFQLSTSANLAGGYYNIIQNGDITISNYQRWTEVAEPKDERELNDSLISVFNRATSYEVINNTLTFEGEVGEVVFEKE